MDENLEKWRALPTALRDVVMVALQKQLAEYQLEQARANAESFFMMNMIGNIDTSGAASMGAAASLQGMMDGKKAVTSAFFLALELLHVPEETEE